MPQIDIALLGLGNVGRAFARYISDDERIRIRAVADSSGGILLDRSEQIQQLLAHKEAGRSIRDFAAAAFVKDAPEFVESLSPENISVLVESLPTNLADGQPALDSIKTALERGTSVVTVDKGPLASGFDALKEAARTGNSKLAYSGTTGVIIPDEITGERVLEIRGVLNGTTNYILTEMQQRNISFDEALANAQENGIAEPDPSLDVDGWDTAVKILILAKTLMGADAKLGDVSRIGIGAQTGALIENGRATGRTVRLVGRARIWQGRVRVSVAPKLLAAESPFYSVEGTSKLAVFRTEGRGEVTAYARSGRDAISQTILDDIIKVARLTAR
jgi:homoserine dehydrogenase